MSYEPISSETGHIIITQNKILGMPRLAVKHPYIKFFMGTGTLKKTVRIGLKVMPYQIHLPWEMKPGRKNIHQQKQKLSLVRQ